MKTIDGDLLFQAIDPLTRKISPQFYQQFQNVGQETIDLMIELKKVIQSRFSQKPAQIKAFIQKLDAAMPNLPTPIQTWFRKAYRTKIPDQYKVSGLQTLDKLLSFDALMELINPLQWYRESTIPPYLDGSHKIPVALPVPKNLLDYALTALTTKQKLIGSYMSRAKLGVIDRVSKPTKSQGQIMVGDYEAPKRLADAAAGYAAKVVDFLGVNAKYVLDNFQYDPVNNNLQINIPTFKVPMTINTPLGNIDVSAAVFGFVNKTLEATNPFIPKIYPNNGDGRSGLV